MLAKAFIIHEVAESVLQKQFIMSLKSYVYELWKNDQMVPKIALQKNKKKFLFTITRKYNQTIKWNRKKKTNAQ